jgi:hypothetical protein
LLLLSFALCLQGPPRLENSSGEIGTGYAAADIPTGAPPDASNEAGAAAVPAQLASPEGKQGPDLGGWPERVGDRLAGRERVGGDQPTVDDRPKDGEVRGPGRVELGQVGEVSGVLFAEESDLSGGLIDLHLALPLDCSGYLNDSIVPDVSYQRNMNPFSM